jgi:hypothetical protein
MLKKKYILKKWQFMTIIFKIREENGYIDDDLKQKLMTIKEDKLLEMGDIFKLII